MLHPLSLQHTSRPNVESPFPYLGELVLAESLIHLHDRYASGDILLFGYDQKHGIAEGVFVAQPVQVLPWPPRSGRDHSSQLQRYHNVQSVLVEVVPLTPHAAHPLAVAVGRRYLQKSCG